ncbi:MAG: hypothetical protein COB08_002610 [Rhodobacteraceae bacterium]|nr:hypothetical protein [Paracoccaceae bacterium]
MRLIYGNVSALNALAARASSAVNLIDNRGYTPLYSAAGFNANPKIISAHLALGAEVDARAEEDVSGLDLLDMPVTPEVLRRIFAAGANPAIPNASGLYPHGMAMLIEMMQGADILEKRRLAVTPRPPEPEMCLWPSAEFWFDITLDKADAYRPM